MLEEDVKNTGKCDVHKATKEDVEALTFSKGVLADRTKESVEATKAFQRFEGLGVPKVNDPSKTISPADKYHAFYADLKAAYITKLKSKAVVDKYIEKNPSANTAVTDYMTNYMVLWKL